MPPPNPSKGLSFERELIQKWIPPTYISAWSAVKERINQLERETHWGTPKSGFAFAEMHWCDCDLWVAFQVAKWWQRGGKISAVPPAGALS